MKDMLLILQLNKTTSTHTPTYCSPPFQPAYESKSSSLHNKVSSSLGIWNSWDLTCTTIAIRISGNAIPSTPDTIARPAQVEQPPLRQKELRSIYTFSPLSWLHLIFFKRWKLWPLFSVKTDRQHSSGEQSGVSSQSSSFKTQAISFQAWRANRASPSYTPWEANSLHAACLFAISSFLPAEGSLMITVRLVLEGITILSVHYLSICCSHKLSVSITMRTGI